MGMFGYATGTLLRLPKFLGLPVRTEIAQISTAQLEAVLNQVENVTQKARDLVVRRSLALLTTSPESRSWSVTQCLDHLALTTTAVLLCISAAIVRAPRLPTVCVCVPTRPLLLVSMTSMPHGVLLKSHKLNLRRRFGPPLSLPSIN